MKEKKAGLWASVPRWLKIAGGMALGISVYLAKVATAPLLVLSSKKMNFWFSGKKKSSIYALCFLFVFFCLE